MSPTECLQHRELFQEGGDQRSFVASAFKKYKKSDARRTCTPNLDAETHDGLRHTKNTGQTDHGTISKDGLLRVNHRILIYVFLARERRDIN